MESIERILDSEYVSRQIQFLIRDWREGSEDLTLNYAHCLALIDSTLSRVGNKDYGFEEAWSLAVDFNEVLTPEELDLCKSEFKYFWKTI